MVTDKDDGKDNNYIKLVEYACVVLATVVLSMAGFWLTIGNQFVTRAEARDISVREVQIFTTKLDLYYDEIRNIKSVIEKNTEAINSLKIELAKKKEEVK